MTGTTVVLVARLFTPAGLPHLASPSKELPAMAPNPLVVGAPSYGALPGRMRCGPYRGEERNLQEVLSRHGAAQRLTFAYKGEEHSEW